MIPLGWMIGSSAPACLTWTPVVSLAVVEGSTVPVGRNGHQPHPVGARL
jgi:hypothetical protein